MINPGQTLENPVTGEHFTFTHTSASTDGELLAFDFALRPGGAVPIPHVHPIQTERFEVTEGRMRFKVGLRTVMAGPGDVVEVEPGVSHSFANAGDEEARLHVEVRPALAMEDMFADVIAMAQAVHVAPSLKGYIVDLAEATRHHPDLALGVSPRAARGLQRATRARAAAAGRDYVVPDDLKALAAPVLEHRLALTPEAQMRGVNRSELLAEVLGRVPVPSGRASAQG